VFESYAIETGLYNVIFKVSLHQALWPLAKYAMTSKMLHKKNSRRGPPGPIPWLRPCYDGVFFSVSFYILARY